MNETEISTDGETDLTENTNEPQEYSEVHTNSVDQTVDQTIEPINIPSRRETLNKPLFVNVLGTKKPVVNTKFDTKVFTSHCKDVNLRINDDVLLKRKCARAIAGNLISTARGMKRIQDKMDKAREREKNSTNIYEVDLYERILLLQETITNEDGNEVTIDEFYTIQKDDIKRKFMEYEDGNGVERTLEITDDVGISVIDLIKGPRNDKYWMKRNDVLTIPEILQKGFISSCHADIRDSILENLNNQDDNQDDNQDNQDDNQDNHSEVTLDSFSSIEWKQMMDDYILETEYIIPRIYYHYNRNWNRFQNREQNDRPGKFAIELDWSGKLPSQHSGIAAGHIPKRSMRGSGTRGVRGSKGRYRGNRQNRNLS